MLKTVVRVFRLASHGQLPGQMTAEMIRAIVREETRAIVKEETAALRAATVDTQNNIKVLKQRGNASMAPSEQRRLDELRRACAQLVVDKEGKKPRQAWRIIGNLVHDASKYCGPLKDLPLHRYQDVIRALELMKRRLEGIDSGTPPLPFAQNPTNGWKSCQTTSPTDPCPNS